ncbi:MAG: ABC transporter permease [Candidatus Methanomethylicia archaeon]
MSINYLLLTRFLLILVVIGSAFIVGGIIIALCGGNALLAFYWLFQGAFTPMLIPETLVRATPLLLISEGLVVAFSARMWNIGAEGQFYMGGISAAIFCIIFKYFTIPMQPIALLLAGLSGALWALAPSILKVRYGINEIITTLMLNYIAMYFVSYLLQGPFRDPVSMFPETESIPLHLQIPVVVGGTRLHLGVVFSFFVIVPVTYYFLERTNYGLRIKILGSSSRVAQYSKIHCDKVMIQSMLISGFLAGLAGGIEVLAVQHKMRLELSPSYCQYGYTGIAVALLSYLNPILTMFISIFIGGLINGSMTMHRMASIPVGMANIIQSLIIVFILIGYYVEDKLSWRILERLRRK